MAGDARAVLVSACLLGKPCRYDAKARPESAAVTALLTVLAEKGLAVLAHCPECAGGLPTLRPPAEIESGKTAAEVLSGAARVMTKDGRDVTREYVAGAQDALSLCRERGVRLAILKAKSPSCGNAEIYDGTFSGHLVSGRGVTAELLESNGIRAMNEADVERFVALAEHFAE